MVPEKLEQCPGCGSSGEWIYDAQRCESCGFDRLRTHAVSDLRRAASALEEAIAVAEACISFHDEQVNRHFQGKRPNWRKASSACFDEIDGKPDQWRAVLAKVRPVEDET